LIFNLFFSFIKRLIYILEIYKSNKHEFTKWPIGFLKTTDY